MPANYASAQECRRLFQLMDQVKALAPWEWLTETDIFGVQAADADEPDYVSVMGMAGEHFAIAVYPGDLALTRLLRLEQHYLTADPMDLMLIPQFQASFEDRNTLTDQDRKMLKDLGLKYRGRNAWPMLRAQQPSFLPWYLGAADVPRLERALTQLLVVAPHAKEDPDYLIPEGDNLFLVRRADTQGWQDHAYQPNFVHHSTIEIDLNGELMDTVYALPQVTNVLEFDLFLLPMPIAEQHEQPYFPHNLLGVEQQSGVVVGSEIMAPQPSLDAMYSEVPNQVLAMLARLGVMPQVIQVESDLLASLLSGLEQLGLTVEKVDETAALNEAKGELMGFMGLNPFGF